MSAWPETALRDLLADATPGFACGEDAEDGVFQLRMNNITAEGRLDLSKRRRVPRGYRNIDRFLVQPGDIMFNATNSPDLVGKTAFFPGIEEPTVFSNHFLRLRSRDGEIDGRYLTRWLNLQFLLGRFKGMCRQWVNQATVSRDALLSLKVPLPPIAEQRRIAEILDKADALRAKRRAALGHLDTLTRSIFLDMFGDPAINPMGWRVVSIADICEVKGGKRLPKGEEYSSVPTPFRYIRVVDLKEGFVDESSLVYLKPDIQAEIARYVVNTGDVILSIAGSIGLAAAVPESLDGANLTENAAKLVPRIPGQYEAEYLAKFLESDHAQGQIGSHVGQVTIGKLALFRIEKIKVSLPPIEVQREFVRRMAAVGTGAAVQRAAASRFDELFASLQHHGFRGEL